VSFDSLGALRHALLTPYSDQFACLCVCYHLGAVQYHRFLAGFARVWRSSLLEIRVQLCCEVCQTLLRVISSDSTPAILTGYRQYQPYNATRPPDAEVLPSDSRFRTDLKALKQGRIHAT